MFSGCLDHFSAFENIVRAGLFDVHVFIGLAAPNHVERMPVIWRCKCHRIDGPIVQHSPHIVVGLDRVAAPFAPNLFGGLEFCLVAVANACEFHADIRFFFKLNETLGVRLGSAPHADDRDPNFVVQVLATNKRRGGQRCRGGERGGL